MSILSQKNNDRNLNKRILQSKSEGISANVESKNGFNLPDCESTKLSLTECRKIVTNGENEYTDEELIKMRDWLDNLANITLTILERTGIDEMNEILNRVDRR